MPKESNPNNATENDTQSAETNGFKTSPAIKIWLGVLVLVLTVLWLQTRHTRGSEQNLVLTGDSTAIGASVSLDGKPAGCMKASENVGLGGAVFYGQLPDGEHEIEVSKKGYDPYVTKLTLKGAAFQEITLKQRLHM